MREVCSNQCWCKFGLTTIENFGGFDQPFSKPVLKNSIFLNKIVNFLNNVVLLFQKSLRNVFYLDANICKKTEGNVFHPSLQMHTFYNANKNVCKENVIGHFVAICE